MVDFVLCEKCGRVAIANALALAGWFCIDVPVPQEPVRILSEEELPILAPHFDITKQFWCHMCKDQAPGFARPAYGGYSDNWQGS